MPPFTPLEPVRPAPPDPLATLLAPPQNETPVERQRRMEGEWRAKQISDSIDAELQREKSRRRNNEIKVLLLGQSESGKTTTLKQLQLMYTHDQWNAERLAWRTIIYLNVVRSIRRILDAIAPVDENDEEASSSRLVPVAKYDVYRHFLAPLEELEKRLLSKLSPEAAETSVVPSATIVPSLTPPFAPLSSKKSKTGRGLRTMASTPLLKSPSTASFASASGASPISPTLMTRAGSSSVALAQVPIVPANSSSSSAMASSSPPHSHEFAVSSRVQWKKKILGENGPAGMHPKDSHSGEVAGWWEDPSDPVHTLQECAPRMAEMWNDSDVRSRLRQRGIRLEEDSGFYLNDLNRITSKRYIPTDDDVLKARLKTHGIREHCFLIPDRHRPNEQPRKWVFYDVGGGRPRWVPYFDDAQAIIFLAPISAFDQYLPENPQKNRLRHSLELWSEVVSNPLLQHATIVLFLNKIDLLRAKLKAGVRLNQYMTSYDQPTNDFGPVTQYLKKRFTNVYTSKTPNKDRELFVHLTAVTDRNSTTMIISDVHEAIVRTNLRMFALT